MINLLTNAMKFTYKGYIKVAVSYDTIKNSLLFSVEDTGLGISQEDQSNLFKLFGKLESSKDVNTNGIGLGLYIC